jgi:2-haloacid dehalogenase
MMPARPVPVFDMGGVVIDWNPRHLFRKFFPGDPESMERFLREVNFWDWNAGMDRGRPFADGVADASARFPRYADLLRTFDERWEETAVGPIPGMPELLGRLHERGNILYGISNSSSEKFSILRRKFALLRLFSDILLSGEVGMNKPDPQIFRMFLERTGLSREGVLFIDDTAANVEAARCLGWDAVIFSSVRNLESAFCARGLL